MNRTSRDRRSKRVAAVCVGGALGLAALAAGLPSAATPGDPQVVQTRRALDFLGTAAVDWQDRFDCSGCHKQSLTLAALGVALVSGHDPAPPGIVDTLIAGMLSGDSGQVADGCFSLRGQSSFTVASSFGGRGLEAYDRHHGAEHRADLLDAADCLVGRQSADGRLASDHTELPVAQGDFITTAHGVLTWLRAFEVGGDASHDTAAADAVSWLRGQIAAIEANPGSFTTQDKAMLLLGLGASGAGTADPDVVRMRTLLAADQQPDDSWKIDGTTGGGNAHGTGQAIFALRSAGYDRSDSVVDVGTQWLIDNLATDGSWPADHWKGGGPSDLAPSMWGALALATYPSELDTLRLGGGATTTIEWATVDGASAYDLIRGDLAQLALLADRVDLGNVTCLAAATTATTAQDATTPAVDQGFFYLMRIRWAGGHDIYGRSRGGLDRIPLAGDCPP